MALKDAIQEDMKTALLGGNRLVGDTLRNLKAAILDVEVARGKRDEGLSDSEIEEIIAREVKKRKESIAVYEENGRPELAEVEQSELDILSKYLPDQLDDSELTEIVDAVINDLGADGPQMMGQVIGAVKQKVGLSADGALIAKIVKEKLN